MCAKRRFAFRVEDAGPDEPDDSCEDPSGTNAYGNNNGICEDGLMWSVTVYPPRAKTALSRTRVLRAVFSYS